MRVDEYCLQHRQIASLPSTAQNSETCITITSTTFNIINQVISNSRLEPTITNTHDLITISTTHNLTLTHSRTQHIVKYSTRITRDSEHRATLPLRLHSLWQLWWATGWLRCIRWAAVRLRWVSLRHGVLAWTSTFRAHHPAKTSTAWMIRHVPRSHPRQAAREATDQSAAFSTFQLRHFGAFSHGCYRDSDFAHLTRWRICRKICRFIHDIR